MHRSSRARPVVTVAALASAIVLGSTMPTAAAPTPEADESTWVVMDDFEAGSLNGWRAAGGGSGGWFSYTDEDTAPDPEMVSFWPFAMPDPPQGESAAVTDMNGWGTFVIYRDVVLEGRFAIHLTGFYESAAPLSTVETLRWDDFGQVNQQFRIDILDQAAPFDSVADADVLVDVLRTGSGDATSLEPTPVSADLSELSGRTVRVRLAVATNQAGLRAGVDHIRFEPLGPDGEIAFPSTTPAPGAPAIDALGLVEPTGSHPVGMSVVRTGDPVTGEPRVSLWYPAAGDTGSEARYVTPEQSRQIMLAFAPVYGPSWDILSTTHTHAIADAQPLDEELPLVVLLPGLALPASSLSGLAVDLASRGYAVAAIDHSVGASGSSAGRATEASLVVDGLLEHGPVGIDPERIGVVGHSLGGEAVAVAMRTDPRLLAGVSLDSTFPPDLSGDLDRPFLMLDSPAHAGETSSSNWRQLTGWRRWLIVDGIEHLSFTDRPVLLEQLGFETVGASIDGVRSAEIVRAYVGAFMDQHLAGEPQELLEGPSEDYPEVSFQDPQGA